MNTSRLARAGRETSARCSVANKRTRRCYAQIASRIPSPVPPEVALQLQEYALRDPRPATLSALLGFASPPTSESVLASADYTLSEVPRRLAQRVQALESLPYIVGTNPFIFNIINGYRESFQRLASRQSVLTLEDNKAFIEELNNMVKTHANDIATMAKGFQECTKYLQPSEISTFLDAAITSRISLRLIAEQHIAISRALTGEQFGDHHLGVVDTRCSPTEMIRICASFVTELCEATLGASPPIVLEGETDVTFAYVPVHLEYILTEILKNSFRASVEHHHKRHGASSRVPIPEIRLTIAPPTPRGDGKGSYLSLRIRDQGGGIPPANLDKIFSYSFSTAGRSGTTEHDEGMGGGPYAAQHVGGMAAIDQYGGGSGGSNMFGEITGKGLQTGLGTIAGLGYGLPMARLYASYFSGSLQLVPLYGHGTDCFVKLRCLDDVADVIV